MEWISIKDRFPPINTPIIVFGEKEHESSLDIHLGKFLLVEEIDGRKIECWENGCGYDITNVTHWILIPEPPKPDSPTQG